MTEDDSVVFPPNLFAKQMQEFSKDAVAAQQEWFEQLSEYTGMGTDNLGPSPLQLATATFKTRVQSNGRISIPDAEREALDIEDGDIVQAVVIPIKRNRE